MESIKNTCFEYIIKCMSDKIELKEFTTLKAMKLLFFVVGASFSDKKDKVGLTNVFDNFVAMPYGPVESDIYNSIQNDELTSYAINSSDCVKKNNDKELNIDDALKGRIDFAIDNLLNKNEDILKYKAFELVDISHKWSCWEICYNIASNSGKKSISIPSSLIFNSIKYYK